jgi:hypothetical protein
LVGVEAVVGVAAFFLCGFLLEVVV